uniref:KH-like RNA-binding domain-containing protein n=1 Tax=Ursus maritimus TaxID=29073 RepID=A0A452U7K5_URSMA
MRACSEKPRWAVSETLDLPLVFYMEEDPEEPIFPRCIEAQATAWFTAAGHIRVAVVGPPEARRWLFDMIWSLESWRSDRQAQGLKMLQLVPSHPLTKDDLAVSPSTQLFARCKSACQGGPDRLCGFPRLPIPNGSLSSIPFDFTLLVIKD